MAGPPPGPVGLEPASEPGGAAPSGSAPPREELIYSNTVTWREAAMFEREAARILQADPNDPLANYAMAAVAEFSGDLPRMEAFLERTGLQIGIDMDEYSLVLHRRTEQSYVGSLGQRQGRQPYFILSLPKSSSTFLAACIMRIGGLPRVRVSKGSFVTGRIIPTWLRTFIRDGGVLHDHAPPTADNLRKLRADPPAKLVLLIRDPVTATLSLCDYVVGENMDKFFGREVAEVDLSYLRRLDGPVQRTAMFQKFFPPLASWLEGWLAVAGEGLPGCQINLLKFEEAVQDSMVTLARIEAFFDGRNRCFDPADESARQQVAELFERLRVGTQRTITEYRGKRPAVLGDTEQELVWRAMRSCPNLALAYDLAAHLR